MIDSKRTRSALVILGLSVCMSGGVFAGGLDTSAVIFLDQHRVPTILAKTEHDAIFLQGYMHAKDRLFQMDVQRRLFSGRLSEMVGPAGLAQDVQLRTLGLRRAAERSLPVQTPASLEWLEAYADGVNAFLGNEAEPLPVEYGALEMDRGGIPPWTPTDCLVMVKGLAFGLSFDLGDIDRTLALLNFLGVGDVLGFNGLQLFQDDLYRTAPFDPTISIPGAASQATSPPDVECPADGKPVAMAQSMDECSGAPNLLTEETETYPDYVFDPNFKSLVQGYRDMVADIPVLEERLEGDFEKQGSNWWVVSGALTESGFPMIANDPHLSLGTAATFYEIHLSVDNGINVAGISFPGAPGVILGCNDTICWGATVNSLDATDVYNEVLIPLNPAAPFTPTHTLFQGTFEPLVFIPQQFNFNIIGDGELNNTVNAGVPAGSGGVTLIVPRRNNGPIVNVSVDLSSPTPITGLSVMYTGWGGTQEIETFRRFARAVNPGDFKDALQFFDVGSQNWGYADINGNIAYYTSGELPIREDLQNFPFLPAGLITPAIIRDGTNASKHEWMPVLNPQPKQSLPFEILPFSEMPQVENPPSGVILNANNDPIGTTIDNVSWNQFRAGFNGRLYLAPGYATGYRQGRLKQLMDDALAAGPLTTEQSIDIQANNQLLDAEVMTPHLTDAFANATAVGADPLLAGIAVDPRVAEAIGRLSAWDFSSPTGIVQGFDPGDTPGVPSPPDQAEIDASVAATIYSVWRGQVVPRVIDQTLASLPIPLDSFAPGSAQSMSALRRLLDNYQLTGGTGASLINFFNVPGASDQFAARDIILLQSLQQALDLLASDDFAPAFGNSTNQEDYRWGYLHRIVFSHPLGGPFDIPPPGHPLNVSPNLPGVARAGGMGAIDASSHSVRANGLNEFMFGSGPARRFIATMTPDGPEALEVLPGGESGIPGSPTQIDQLFLWLVNAFHVLPLDMDLVAASATTILDIQCGQDLDADGFRFGGNVLCNQDLEDCDDFNPLVWSSPDEVHEILFTDKTTLTWDQPENIGAISVVYDVITSTAATDFMTGAGCPEFDDGSDTMAQVNADPARGTVMNILVRAENDCVDVGQGSSGASSQGMARAARDCP